MKKSLILALVLSALMLVMVMSVSVSADPSLTIGDVTVTKDIDNNLVTFTVPYTAVDVEQITVIAVKGTKNAEPAATTENIVYVNQQSSENGNSFTFNVPYDKFTIDSPYCWIKIGGTSIATAQSAGGEEIWVSTSALVYGDVNNDNQINISDVVSMLKFISYTNTSNELVNDTTLFPYGEDTPAVCDVNGDEGVNISDVVLTLTYISQSNTSGLNPVQFPDGKFPAYSKQQ